MIEVNIAITTKTSVSQPTYGTPALIETIQCEHYDIVDGGITFYRMRFISGGSNPGEYFASFFFPLHQVVWMQRRFAPGMKFPNYDMEKLE